jgi:hypothetical protein
MLGSRDLTVEPPVLQPFCDVLERYPERRTPTTDDDFTFRDAFHSGGDKGDGRPVPPPGTAHQYRICAVDMLGRPGPWTESAVVALEKHVPPPLPAGPDGDPSLNDAPAPTGVHAEVFVAGDPTLPDDLARSRYLSDVDRERIHSMAGNAIVLRWGWHQQQRDHDPYAVAFGVYVSRPRDTVGARATSVTPFGDGWHVELDLDRAIGADSARATTVQLGYPFNIRTHTGGRSITAELDRARLPGPDGTPPAPQLVATALALRWAPALTRASEWDRRVMVVPITGDDAYYAVLFDELRITPDRPRDAVWVGVSSSDGQRYVADTRARVGDPFPDEPPLPGNESAVAPAACHGRWRRPAALDVPPAIRPVDVVVAPEPTAQSVAVSIDLAAHGASLGVAPGAAVHVERASASAVLGGFRVVDGGQVLALVPDPREAEPDYVAFDLRSAVAPEDADAMVAALPDGDPSAMADRYLCYLASVHPYADRLFATTGPPVVVLGPFHDVLPGSSDRWMYRIRRSDGGVLSVNAAVLPVIVRVPSTTAPPAPQRQASVSTAELVGLKLWIPDEPAITHLSVWFRRFGVGGPPSTAARLVRIASRPDLYPDRLADVLRLQTTEGWLPGAVVAAAGGAPDPAGGTLVTVELPIPPGGNAQVWACTVSRDAIPSRLLGPFRVTNLTQVITGGVHP